MVFFFWLIALIHSLAGLTVKPQHIVALCLKQALCHHSRKKYSIEYNVFEKFVCHCPLPQKRHADLEAQIEVESVEQAMDILVSAGLNLKSPTTSPDWRRVATV